MCDLKKWFLKTQLNIWQNRNLAFKILRFQKNIILPVFWKNRFFFQKHSSQTIYVLQFRFKIVPFFNKIIISNAP
jgi:hypothetical protein